MSLSLHPGYIVLPSHAVHDMKIAGHSSRLREIALWLAIAA